MRINISVLFPAPARLLIGLLALLLLGAPADAQVRWRLAGTMNSWNTSDAQWEMAADPDVAGRFVLERQIQQGQYNFKFVKDGDWSRGHLGASDPTNPVSLEQPGADIPLNIRVNAIYRITLDPEAGTWSLTAAKLDKPVIDAYVFGRPTAHRPFLMDFSRSLVGDVPAEDVSLALTSSTEGVSINPHPNRPMSFMVAPPAPGPFSVTAELRAGDKQAIQTLEFEALELYRFLFESGSNRNAADLIPIADGVWRLHFPCVVALPFLETKFFRGMGDRLELIYDSGEQVDSLAGNFAVEIRDGEVRTVEEHRGVPFFIPGYWHKFEYTPTSMIETVHLVGDFNDWEPTVELIPDATQGKFRTVLDLPGGAHRYGFLIDGRTIIPDPNAEVSELDLAPTGEQCSILFAGPMPEEFPAPRPNHVYTGGTNHNPNLERDFAPISPELGLVDLGVTTLPNDVEKVFAVVYNSPNANSPNGELRVPMQRSTDRAGFDRFSARVLAGTPEITYTFVFVDGNDVQATNPITKTIDPEPDTPAWAMGATWYQIFPERFRNGLELNDPHGPGVYQAKWNSDWYETQPGEEAQWRKRAGLTQSEPLPPRQGGELYHWVWDRRYGGDLQGVMEKLDYLADLGITAIYFNPVFEADSMHKYDASDFRHIDDNFGNTVSQPTPNWDPDTSETEDPATWKWTEADRFFIDEFLPAAHERGIKIVIDGVFNHTGRNFWAFRDILENGEDSPYADWFFVEFDENGMPESWRAWDSPSGWLPKFRQTQDGNLVDPVKQHIFDITRRWQDPNGDGDPSDGVDGWRLDVALDIGLPFWREWREVVKETNPDAIIIAEIWEDASHHLRGDTFDTQMHYPFAHAVTDWLGVRPGMPTSELIARLESAFNDAPQTALIHQNLFGSHDTDRFVSMLLNPNRGYDQGNRPQDNGPNYVDERPSKKLFELSVVGAAIQATYLGAPMIYYGDEVGMWGADDPTDRKTYPWPDTGRPKNEDDAPLPAILRQYKHWFSLRQHPQIGPVLRFGTVTHIPTDNPDVFIFERTLNADRVLVVANRGDRPFNASEFLEAGADNAVVGPRSADSWYLPGM